MAFATLLEILDVGAFDALAEDEEPEDDEEYEESSVDGEDVEGQDEEGNGDAVEDEEEEEEEAEQEIAGDFDRLVQGIRMRDASAVDTGVLAKDWDISIEEQEAEFRDDLRAASGIGKRRKRKARTSGPALSQQVRSLIGDGNQAYIDNNFREAIRIMQEVIRIEPRAVAAWTVLAQCYDDIGQRERALQLRIMAAHLRHDSDDWERLGRQSRELGFLQQALYCYRKVYALDPTNVDALWERASLAKQLRDFKTARNAYVAILRRFPHDLPVLNELHIILVELNELALCADLFQQAFDHYHKLFPTGRLETAPDLAQPQASTSESPTQPTHAIQVPFGAMELFILADLYTTLGHYEKAIHVIRSGIRWLQGRSSQRYWDLCADDREFDGEEVNRAGVSGGVVGAGAEGVSAAVAEGSAENGSMAPGANELDINARHRLAVARIKMGDVEEGKIHANIILSQDVFDYSPLFVETADAYYEKELYADARPIYELLGSDPLTSSMYILLQTAACLRMLDELKEAAEVYECIRQADSTNTEVKTKLAEVYELLNEPRKALDLIYEVIDARKKRQREPGGSNKTPVAGVTPLPPMTPPQTESGGISPTTFEFPQSTSSLFTESRSGGAGHGLSLPGGAGGVTLPGAPVPQASVGSAKGARMTHAQLIELEESKEKEVIRAYKRLLVLWPSMFGWEKWEEGEGPPNVREEDEMDVDVDNDDDVGEEELERRRREKGKEKETEETAKAFGGTRDDAEREWMIEAEKLVETFRETRKLFLSGKQYGFRGMFPRRKRMLQPQKEIEADEDRMATRLVLEMEYDTLSKKQSKQGIHLDNFRGVSFEDWLRVIIQYAFVLTQRGQFEMGDEVLRHILLSNAYQGREHQDTIRIALMTCAIHANHPMSIVEHSRKLINAHQFNNEPLRLMVASLSSGLRSTDAFITSTLQKHMFREMRMADAAVKNPEGLKWSAANRRWAPGTGTMPSSGNASGARQKQTGSGQGQVQSKGKGKPRGREKERDRNEGDGEMEEEDEDEDMDIEPDVASSSTRLESVSVAVPPGKEPTTKLPTKQNPVIVTLYGQLCIAAKSYQSAIFYFLHAYDYCPDDPLVCLCLAIASIGRAMQRQADNRHHLITQGLAFLSKYRTLRGTNAKGMLEVEYNFGRAFHQLGLYSYAVKHYQRVLELAEIQEPEGVRRVDQHQEYLIPSKAPPSRSYILPPAGSTEPVKLSPPLEDGKGCVKEAAYNLAFIYVMTGAVPLAKALYRRWLSI
ncbi:TPR-like protein [Pluteus cervinus]|uniref:TPR-like protein n=1 Tax=Pluteus cervinus TaxID=181527 RepID=A0ACD3B3H5_9AGAR|nr:TPR-like protein [Pluteus cervinus]